jgi:hypothetical protein
MDVTALRSLVDEGLGQKAIAKRLGASQSGVRYHLDKLGLETHPPERPIGCSAHGVKKCPPCRAQAVSKRRKVIRETLIAERGGKCQQADCAVPGGYDRDMAALDFHHLDRATKVGNLSTWKGDMDSAREEAKKCILVCSNCHREIERKYHLTSV